MILTLLSLPWKKEERSVCALKSTPSILWNSIFLMIIFLFLFRQNLRSLTVHTELGMLPWSWSCCLQASQAPECQGLRFWNESQNLAAFHKDTPALESIAWAVHYFVKANNRPVRTVNLKRDAFAQRRADKNFIWKIAMKIAPDTIAQDVTFILPPKGAEGVEHSLTSSSISM